MLTSSITDNNEPAELFTVGSQCPGLLLKLGKRQMTYKITFKRKLMGLKFCISCEILSLHFDATA
jgi:hypothetical protein